MNIRTEFQKELLERIGNIESRLESIWRMLGDQEEDCPVIDRKVATDKLDELLSRPDPILEPEWRPMSTAPAYKGARIEVVTHNNVVAKVTFDADYIYHPWRFDTYNGFGGDELKGWRPL